MAEITVSKLSKSFGIKEIFSDVSFHLNKGDKVGIVGPNGAGKSTLFNILSGRDSDYTGDVFKKSSLKIGYMHQNISLQSENTIYQEMLEVFSYIHEIEAEMKRLEGELANYHYLEELERNTIKYTELIEKYADLGGQYFENKIDAILIGMGFPRERFDDPIVNLSGGEKSRLELAKLLISDADILLLDEPTNHLDMSTIAFVESFIKDSKKTLVFISHDRYFLDKVANRILLLEKGIMRSYDSNYTTFIERRKKEIEVEQRAYENQQKEIERQEEIIERFASQGGSLRKRGIAQSRSRQKLLDKMKKLERPEFFDEKMALKFTPARISGQDVLSVKNVTKSFANKTLYKDISFDIYRGQKVGLIGGNGTGKTTLFKMILNKMKPDVGCVDLGESVFPEYFDQEQKNLDLEKTVIDELWDKYPNLTHYDIRSYLAKFMFIGDDIFQIVGDLSGGERSRITLLELMLSDANFLLMDEPTNHLDIDSKEVLEEALNSYEATAFMISHDRYFLNKVCDQIIEIKDQTITIYKGNYDYYLSKQENFQAEETIVVNKTQQKKDMKKEKEFRKQIKQVKTAISKIENRIDRIDQEIEKINLEFTKPEVFEDFEKTQEFTQMLASLNDEKEEIGLEWLDLHEKLEELEKEAE